MANERDELERDGYGSLDQRLSGALSDFSQKVSRRSIVAKLGKGMLTLMGVGAIVQALPVDRRAQAALIDDAQDSACAGWKMCGVCGHLCNCCNGPSLGVAACPTCANVGSYWSACCCKPDAIAPGLGRKYNVQYQDCCKGSCSTDKIAQCHGCTWCANGCPQYVWGCNGDPARYVCTKVVVGSECGYCNSIL